MKAIEYADTDLLSHVEHFQHRVLQDALTEATAAYWLRRADQFEAAKPTLADKRGRATAADLGAKWRELDQIARACRERASVSLVGGHDVVDAEVLGALAEVREVA